MQPVIGDIVLPDILPDLVIRPVYERVQFDNSAVALILFDHLHLRPGYALFSTQPCNPRIQTAQSAREGLHLANLAALMPPFQTLPKRVKAMLPLEFLHYLSLRVVCFDINAVSISHLLHYLIGRLVQPPRIKSKHSRFLRDTAKHVHQHNILGPETTGECDATTKLVTRPLQHLFR